MLDFKLLDFFISRFLIFTTFFLMGIVKCHDVWEQDLSKDMQIGLADGGYEKVRLRCGADSMQVELFTEEDFSGVIYTRGSFHKKQLPCFLDPKEEGRSFSMKIPLEQCQTLHEKDVYSNVLVVQYDKDLIMPGDAAFNLECDFSQPRDVTVIANLQGKKKKVTASRITLTDADPGAANVERHKRSTVESYNSTVEITPEDVKQIKLLRKDEL